MHSYCTQQREDSPNKAGCDTEFPVQETAEFGTVKRWAEIKYNGLYENHLDIILQWVGSRQISLSRKNNLIKFVFKKLIWDELEVEQLEPG